MSIRLHLTVVVITGLTLAGCDVRRSDTGSSQELPISSGAKPLTQIGSAGQRVSLQADELEIGKGQLIYVPAYSHIYHGDGQRFLLAITLSVRNTSLTEPIVVRSVRYYDSAGKLVKEYAQGSLRLEPLATTEFFIPENDSSGGSGASFLVDWVAQTESATAPVVEAVMISTRSQQGLAFVTTGRIIQEHRPSEVLP